MNENINMHITSVEVGNLVVFFTMILILLDGFGQQEMQEALFLPLFLSVL